MGFSSPPIQPTEVEGSPSEIEANKALIESKNLLEAVFNTSTLGLHVLQSVRNSVGTIVDFDILLTNTMSDKIAGRKVSGLRMLEGWPHTKEIGLFDKFIHTVETGQQLDYEQLYIGDGVRAWFRWIASRLNDGLYVTIEDITERKKGEEALQQTADQLQSTFDGVPAIIALLEVVQDKNQEPIDFVISAANKATADFTGCTTSELIGKRMTDLYPEAFRGELQESYLKVYRTGEPLDLEFLYPGLEKWLSIFVTRQVDGKGLVAVALDITEKKKAEEEKKQNQILTSMDRLKTEFFSNVSHEFRTPLTLIIGPLEDAIRNNTIEPIQIQKLQVVHRNALRLQKLVNTLLDFSRIEAGRTDVFFQPTDLAEYTTLLAGNFRSAIEQAGLKLIVKCESVEPVYVNHDMWEKIVLNLLSNAFKFTFEGKIEILLRSSKKHVRLLVRDTGTGISNQNLSRIFDRFTRIENSRSRTYEGSGIGLALVKELVNIHNGSIKVKSKEGKGTEFIISLPKGKAHLPTKKIYELKGKESVSSLSSVYAQETISWSSFQFQNSESNGTPEERPGPQKQPLDHKAIILLVDDNSDLREYIKGSLNRDYIVIDANNGQKALEMISKGLQPDLVLADVMMPEMNGFGLLNEMKRNEQTAGIPFIFLSARASEEAQIEGMRYGADDYLIKPFSIKGLLARIDARIQISAIRNNAERQLKISNNELQLQNKGLIDKQKLLLFQILDVMPQKIWIFDSAGKISFLNKTWYSYTGLTEEQCGIDSQTFGIFHPGQKSEIYSKWKQCIQQGIPYSGECLIKGNDGEYHRHLDFSVPIKNELGEMEMWVRTFIDVDDKSLNTVT